MVTEFNSAVTCEGSSAVTCESNSAVTCESYSAVTCEDNSMETCAYSCNGYPFCVTMTLGGFSVVSGPDSGATALDVLHTQLSSCCR